MRINCICCFVFADCPYQLLFAFVVVLRLDLHWDYECIPFPLCVVIDRVSNSPNVAPNRVVSCGQSQQPNPTETQHPNFHQCEVLHAHCITFILVI